jgi:hypothetical protein
VFERATVAGPLGDATLLCNLNRHRDLLAMTVTTVWTIERGPAETARSVLAYAPPSRGAAPEIRGALGAAVSRRDTVDVRATRRRRWERHVAILFTAAFIVRYAAKRKPTAPPPPPRRARQLVPTIVGIVLSAFSVLGYYGIKLPGGSRDLEHLAMGVQSVGPNLLELRAETMSPGTVFRDDAAVVV